MTAIAHIAGIDIQAGSRLRQRCGWCGAVLIDYDLATVAAPVGQDARPGVWEIGALVEVDGNATVVLDHDGERVLPANACARIDPEVTA